MHSTEKPWLTPKIKAFIAKRQKALAQFGKDSPSFHMWRNKVQASIKTCKRQFYERKVKSLKRTNVSRWWKEVKNISGVSAKDDMWYNQLLGPNTADPLGTLCEKINDFFVGLTSPLSPLTSADVSRISVGVIPRICSQLFERCKEHLTLLKSGNLLVRTVFRTFSLSHFPSSWCRMSANSIILR